MVGNVGTLTLNYVYDSLLPTFVPVILADTKLKPITVLSFAASEPIQSTNMSFVSLGCTFEVLPLSGQTAEATLVGCTAQGSFSLIVTALDVAGNAGNLTIDYIYDSIGPTFISTLAGKSSIMANTSLSFTANEPIQTGGIAFTAPGCTFAAPTVTGKTATVKLLSCTTQDRFLMTVEVEDVEGLL